MAQVLQEVKNKYAKKAILNVIKGNKAKNTYDRMGFKVTSEGKNGDIEYYWMEKDL